MVKLSFVLCLILLCGWSVNGIPGGPKPITDETELLILTQNISTHLSKVVGDQPNSLEFVKLHSATVQTVAGKLYKMLVEINENNEAVNCTLSMWEKSWEDFIKFDVECGEEKRKYGWSSKNIDSVPDVSNPQNIPVFGGFSEMNEDSIKKLHPKLSHSFTELGKVHDDFDFVVVKKILSGKIQTVAGTRYDIKFEAENKNNEAKVCDAKIWEKTFENNFFQVKATCEEKEYNIETHLPQTLV